MTFATLLICFLAGCYKAPTTIPPYVVMLTNYWPGLEGRCTGAVIDATHVLTAAHCNGLLRVIATNGMEATVTDIAYAKHDMALFTLNRPLFVEQYAEIALAHKGRGQIYGTCPYFWPGQPREALHMGLWSPQIEDENGNSFYIDFDAWFALGDYGAVCGGDSGGVVVQDGRVVGIISQVDPSIAAFIAYGQTFYTVPSVVYKEIE